MKKMNRMIFPWLLLLAANVFSGKLSGQNPANDTIVSEKRVGSFKSVTFNNRHNPVALYSSPAQSQVVVSGANRVAMDSLALSGNLQRKFTDSKERPKSDTLKVGNIMNRWSRRAE